MSSYIVAAVGEWNFENFENFHKKMPGEWFFASEPEGLKQLLEKVTPKYIFFPHWRWIVPKEILDEHECVCFHMTDVPYGRGGSPLQNLIVRGHKETRLTALRMEEGLDTGPVYLKHDLSLAGTAEQIYRDASVLTWQMIEEIVQASPVPKPQQGEVTCFKRRTPEQSRIDEIAVLERLYDFVRMLDAPGYPKAFLEYQGMKLELDQAHLENDELIARVKISIKE